MITRRTLLKQGVIATLSVATAISGRRAFSQNVLSTGFDFYISPAGSDSNPGTFEKPWAITAINTRRRDYAGKRVGLLDGTYNVHALCQAVPVNASATALAVNGGPNAATPTVIAAVNARQAILTGAEPSTGDYPNSGNGIIGQGYGQVPNPGNVILDGLTVTRAWQNGIFFFPQIVANTPEGGTTGIIVRNCDVYDVGGIENYNPAGIKTRNCTGVLISNNRIHSVQPGPGLDAAGILTFNSRSNIYEYNTIYDCNSGIFDKNPQNGNHTYRFNYLEIAGAYPGIALRDCSGGNAGDVVTVHNNVLIGPGTWLGVGVRVPSHQSMVFYNNTCYCKASEGSIFYPAAGSQVSPHAMVTFYNNVIYAENPGWGGLARFCSGTLALSNYNVYLVRGRGGLFGLSEVSAARSVPKLYSMSQWQRATGLDGESIASDAAPASVFLSAKSLDAMSYTLQPAAPGRNLGRVGGIASGAPTDAGAWGGGATRIGCDFAPVPRAPVLHVS